MRLRIPKFLKLLLAQPPIRIKNILALQLFQLRNPFSDKVAVFIAFFSLSNGVEDCVAGLPALGVV
jgi:hypothetical protein